VGIVATPLGRMPVGCVTVVVAIDMVVVGGWEVVIVVVGLVGGTVVGEVVPVS